jgi:hypothetical protein
MSTPERLQVPARVSALRMLAGLRFSNIAQIERKVKKRMGE